MPATLRCCRSYARWWALPSSVVCATRCCWAIGIWCSRASGEVRCSSWCGPSGGPWTRMAMKSSPASSAVRLGSCRRIEHLHLADADLGIDRDVRHALAGGRQRGVAVDAEAVVVLIQQAHLTHAAVSVYV